MGGFTYSFQKILTNFDFSNYIYEISKEIIIALIILFIKTISSWIKNKIEKIKNRKTKQIIKVSQSEIEKYNKGKIKNHNESEDALNYLKHGLRHDFEALDLKSADKNKLYQLTISINRFLSLKNILFISLILVLVQMICVFLQWDIPYRTIVFINYLFSSFIFLNGMLVVIEEIIFYKESVSKIKDFIKEMNRALLIIGPDLKINLLDNIECFTNRKSSIDPKEIQKTFSILGMEVRIEEISRVVLAYQYKDKNNSEKKDLSLRILKESFRELGIDYNNFSFEDRTKLEELFFENYLNDPIINAKISPL